MTKLRLLLAFTLIATSGIGCDKVADLFQKKDKTADEDSDDEEEDDSDSKDSDKPKKKKKKKKGEPTYLADTGFRPEKDGFAFKNVGGQYPKTPPVLTENVMVKMFGDKACVNGDTKECTLTLPAQEWAHMVNRYINGGQCEGMAVASLTMFKGADKPKELFAFSAHQVGRKEVTPLIAEYWAYQMTDPVRSERNKSLRNMTPRDVADKLVEMFKKGELATLAFFSRQGGHATTPYAVEDKGNNIQWIKMYDNNAPDEERYIEIDRSANTWKYNLAGINPGVKPMIWGGGADSHSIAVVPMELRLKKATCPFCSDNGGRTTIMPRSTSISITDQDGRKVAVNDDGSITNEIPGAEVIQTPSYLEGYAPLEPMFVMPADNDYDIDVAGSTVAGTSAGESLGDDDKGVAVFTAGSALSVEGAAVSKTDKDTLSIPREGGAVRYRPGTGKMPAMKLAVDDDKEGLSVRVANMKADAGDEVELKLDRKTRKVVVGGGGKKTDSYDLELKRSGGGERGIEREEQKGVKFRLGESHAIETKRPTRVKGQKASPTRIQRGTYVKPPLRVRKDAKDTKGRDEKDTKARDNDKDLKVRTPSAPSAPPKPNDPPSRPKANTPPAPTGAPRNGGPAPRRP
ncbi:MAG: hypothetical protein JNK04_10585 [Myxococcales bacterium]|nr:hypothetical protein [Myxococcales bacterium]